MNRIEKCLRRIFKSTKIGYPLGYETPLFTMNELISMIQRINYGCFKCGSHMLFVGMKHNSIGINVWILCKSCGYKEDIADYGSW
jgi:DNA-directed RNA polymerase subunit RPC12/RpoP